MQHFCVREHSKKYSTFQLQAVIETWRGLLRNFLEGWTGKNRGIPLVFSQPGRRFTVRADSSSLYQHVLSLHLFQCFNEAIQTIREIAERKAVWSFLKERMGLGHPHGLWGVLYVVEEVSAWGVWQHSGCAPILFDGKNFREENAGATKQAAKDIVNRKHDWFLCRTAQPRPEKGAPWAKKPVPCRPQTPPRQERRRTPPCW